MDDTSSMYEFVGIGELAETTTHLLSLNLQQSAYSEAPSGADVGQVELLVLRQARDYLRRVREGFMLSVRTTKVTEYSEIRYLLDRVLTDWSQLSQELGLDDESARNREIEDGDLPSEEMVAQQVQRVQYQLLAFSMAVIALGAMPRMPAKQVTFPHSYSSPPTYSDIPVPKTPGEMLWRIEELDNTVWRMMSSDMQGLLRRRYGPLRRTYGFFEASAWLSKKEAQRFGVKKRSQPLSFY